MESKLKLCPFCGGIAEVKYYMKYLCYYYVGCYKEKCPGNNIWISYYNEVDAITAWNLRVGEKNLKAEIVSLLKELPYLPELSDNFGRVYLLLDEM